MQKLAAIAKEVLSHIEIYLNELSDDDYKRALPLLSDASIGGHTRHVLDGFFCLMHQQSSGTVSYDKRERDKRVECEVCYAKDKLDEINAFVSQLEVNGAFNFEITYDDQLITTNSCLEREMIHNIDHAIHHLAIIKIALLHYHTNINVPKSFGVAPSTLRYWEQEGIDPNQKVSSIITNV